ncbi:uncharacterized protein LOC124288828 [Haliotis rubra]|uniref:uncharacterized protein LOC124288828 n=1 Tax=Haliotis rubra TaxID=36100 RepID=UPI001EE5CC8D|nr:uncharacterized protein LOC124288828 [Haliotis rubra]
MRQGGGHFWINLFKDMESQGIVATDNTFHMFCFTELIQCELDKIATEWNQHTVRRTMENSSGKPDILYFLPAIHGTVDYKTEADPPDIHSLKMMCRASRPSGCEADFEGACETLLQRNGKTKPSEQREAMDLFAWLVTMLE